MKFLKQLFILGIFWAPTAFAQIPTVSIDSVTVLNDRQVSINWQVSPNTTVDGYYVYRIYQNNLGQMIFDAPITINGRNTNKLVYEDNFGQIDLPSEKSLRFWVTAFDKDVNPIAQSGFDTSAVKPHQTVCLTQMVDQCNGTVYLKWNAYSDNHNGFFNSLVAQESYEIYESQNNGPFKKLKVELNNKNSYKRSGLMTGINYRYKVIARSNDVMNIGASSTSNEKSFTGTFSVAPSYVYLYNATTAANNRTVTLYWMTDTSSCRLTYSILMSEDSINFREVARIDSQTYTRFNVKPIDNLFTERFAYYFKIVTTTACPDTIDTSNVVRVVRLKAEYINPTTNKISWNNFEGWAAGTGFFELYRVKKDSAGIDIKDLIATVQLPTLSFTDIDLSPPGIDNATYYYLKTTEDVNDPFNVQSVSLSNRAYVYKEIKIIAPEVFTPNGLTPIFRPRVLTTNNNKFSLKVFNRWGKLVFETTDEVLGWDGKDKDSHDVCTTGAYVYVIESTDALGAVIRKSGTVALID
jgi:gliding motility-associated-like protein